MKAFTPKACLLACIAIMLAASGALSFNLGGKVDYQLPVVQNDLEFSQSGSDISQGVSTTIIKMAPTIHVNNMTEDADVAERIKEAHSVEKASKPQVEVNGQEIEVPQLEDAESAKDNEQVGETMGTFAQTLQSVTNEDECDCDPKDSAKSVRQIIDATSNLSQDLLRCLLETLQSTIKTKEATLIRSIVKESMTALSRSVDGIYKIWKMDIQERNLQSVQTVVDGLMSVLTKFSSRLVGSFTASETERIDTVSFVLNELVTLVANTSLAIGRDIDSGLSGPQLELALQLSEFLAEPLTSKVLAQFVDGTVRLPAINKMLLKYYLESQKALYSCENSAGLRAALPRATFKGLGDSLKSMTIKVATKDHGAAASEAHRVATSNFLYALIREIETLLRLKSGVEDLNEVCQQRVGELLSNVVAIIKKIVETVIPELESIKEQQQASLVGNLIESVADIISSIGGHLVKRENKLQTSNITSLIYQQFEVIRRVAKNDQAIGRDSEAGRKNTIALLVDVSRLEVRYLQQAVERIRSSKNTNLRSTVLRDVSLETIKSQVTVGRGVAPADNKPLADMIKSSGNALTETILLLEKIFKKQPHTFGDVIYEVFMTTLIDTDRKLISSAANPSRSGLATTVPSDVIFGAANAIRTAVDWSNALTRSSGMEPAIQAKLIRFVIEIIVSVETSLDENENEKHNRDTSVIGDLDSIKQQLEMILSDTERGVTTTTAAAFDYEDYFGDYSEKTPNSGISGLATLIHQLDEVLVYIIENNLRQSSSIVLRNAESTINVISVLLEDVSRTPQVNEDGSVNLPSGTLKPCTGGTDTGGNVINTTPKGRDGDGDGEEEEDSNSEPEQSEIPAKEGPSGENGSDLEGSSTGNPGADQPASSGPPGGVYTLRPHHGNLPTKGPHGIGTSTGGPHLDGNDSTRRPIFRLPPRVICPHIIIDGKPAPCSRPGYYSPDRMTIGTTESSGLITLPASTVGPTPSEQEPIFTIEPWLMSSEQTAPPYDDPLYTSPPFRPTDGDVPQQQPVISGDLVQLIKNQTKLTKEDLETLEKLLAELLIKSSTTTCQSFDAQVPQWILTQNLIDVLSSLISRSSEVCPKETG